MANFLTTVHTPMVIFCDQSCVEEIQGLRGSLPSTIIAKPFNSLMCAKEPYASYWMKDIERDHERNYHNPNLYIIWNEKANFVKEAMRLNIYDTSWYCWCDIGCFRDSNPKTLEILKDFPNVNKTGIEQDKMYLLSIEPFTEREAATYIHNPTNTIPPVNLFQYNCRIGGTIFLGNAEVWKKWIPTYYNTMTEFMKHNLFTGKDQSIMAVVALMNPGMVKLVRPVAGQGDPWFYLQRLFA